MCELSDESTPEKRIFTAAATSSIAGIAKAGPGVVVSGLTIAGYSVETWISIFTLIYLLSMLIGSLPKTFEGLRYIWSLSFKRREKCIETRTIDSPDVCKKLKEKE